MRDMCHEKTQQRGALAGLSKGGGGGKGRNTSKLNFDRRENRNRGREADGTMGHKKGVKLLVANGGAQVEENTLKGHTHEETPTNPENPV